MTKHHGLSRLADVAKEAAQRSEAHYPVRRRGERRRLNPNWTGIAWLEADTLEATGIEYVSTPDEDGLVELRAAGWRHAKATGSSYGRPMFEVIPNGIRNVLGQPVTPCDDCDDWAYTSHCPEHNDNTIEGLSKGSARQAWGTIRPWGSYIGDLLDFSITITFEEAPGDGQN